MLRQKQNDEYNLMTISQKRPIKVQIPNGPLLSFAKTWDYKTDLKETVFKTTMDVKETHPLLKVEELDLFPLTAQKIKIVRILRQPESNLKDANSKHRKLLQKKPKPAEGTQLPDSEGIG